MTVPSITNVKVSIYNDTATTFCLSWEHAGARYHVWIDRHNYTIEADPTFKRLSYEIAFTEYSLALGRLMAERDPDIPADDLLYEVRATLNRVALSAAALYA